MRFLATMTLCLMPVAWCGTIGTTVTGDLNFGSGSTNYYDPANGYVPATGYVNSSANFNSPTVVISSGTSTFGYLDSSNLDVSDFSSGTQLFFTDTLEGTSFAGNDAITLTFTDPVFSGSLWCRTPAFGLALRTASSATSSRSTFRPSQHEQLHEGCRVEPAERYL